MFCKMLFQNSLLCCVAAPDQEEPQFSSHLEAPRPARDRVENAFKTFDLDQDGFLTWQEFKQVSISLRWRDQTL